MLSKSQYSHMWVHWFKNYAITLTLHDKLFHSKFTSIFQQWCSIWGPHNWIIYNQKNKQFNCWRTKSGTSKNRNSCVIHRNTGQNSIETTTMLDRHRSPNKTNTNILTSDALNFEVNTLLYLLWNWMQQTLPTLKFAHFIFVCTLWKYRAYNNEFRAYNK